MLLGKAAIPFLLVCGVLAGAQNIVRQTVHSDRVTEIHTALNHISIIALPEKITRVAAGSQAIEIEWHGNDIFIKPLQGGQATDLMVWTEHQFSAYELEAAGDVKQMTFVLDETASPVPQASGTETVAKPTVEEINRITDSAIGSALLHVTPIVPRGVRSAKDQVSVCIKDVVRDGEGLYVRFRVTNNSVLPYRLQSPNVRKIVPQQSADLLPSMKDEQITDRAVSQFRSNQTAQVIVRRTDLPEKDLAPGSTAEGVVEILPEDKQKLGIYEFIFGGDGDHSIKATAVL